MTSILCLTNCQQLSYEQGQRIYESRCSNCHMVDGSGLSAMYPNLQTSELIKNGGAKLACVILNGKKSSIMSNLVMPANHDLSSAELSNLLNYLHHTWGSQKAEVPNDIRRYMDECLR